jgi:cardiolipin synthase
MPAARTIRQLLKGGVKIYERRGALLHSKTALIDGVWSCVGSTNLDWRSFLDNDEINAVCWDVTSPGKCQAMIGSDIAASTEIRLEDWQKRSMLLRVKEWGASLLQRLL